MILCVQFKQMQIVNIINVNLIDNIFICGDIILIDFMYEVIKILD